VAVDEPFRVLGEIVVGIESALQHLVCDILRHVARPAFGGVESDDAESVAVLPGNETADDRLAVRFGDVRLDVGFAELSEVVDDQVDRGRLAAFKLRNTVAARNPDAHHLYRGGLHQCD
jgi:hypothetical protein